jgi:hypothetical protein
LIYWNLLFWFEAGFKFYVVFQNPVLNLFVHFFGTSDESLSFIFIGTRPSSANYGSEQPPVGAHAQENRSTINVEHFCFRSKGSSWGM